MLSFIEQLGRKNDSQKLSQDKIVIAPQEASQIELPPPIQPIKAPLTHKVNHTSFKSNNVSGLFDNGSDFDAT